MADLQTPVETGMPARVKYSLLAVVLMLFVVWLLPRASKRNPEPRTNPATANQNTAAEEQKFSDRECERRLEDILQGLNPESVVVINGRDDRVNELGQWAADCLMTSEVSAMTIDENAIRLAFSGKAQADALSSGFTLRDGHHISTSRLCGEIASRISQQTSVPAEQAELLFKFLIRETQLVPDVSDEQLPGTPFEFLLLGRSTANGRAWTFGTLLRQLKIDAVVIEPRNRPDAWLVGVVIPGAGVSLYDLRLGVPVPGAKLPEGINKPATLESVRKSPDLLRELDTDGHPYALQAGDLDDVNVRLIADSSSASLRMARLQTMLTGPLTELFDGVGKSSLQEQGLMDRVAAAGANGGWKAADVSVWAYPEAQAEQFINSGAEESTRWKTLSEVFAGPVSIDVVRKVTRNENESATEAVVQKSRTPLRLVRVMELEGRTADALRRYGPIRVASRSTVTTRDPEMLVKLREAFPLNMQASDFACYWTALCQLQMGKPDLAIETLKHYARDFPTGQKITELPELWATALAESGKVDQAVQLLQSGGKLSPRLAILLKVYRSQLAAVQTPAAEPKPADPKPAEPAAEPKSAPKPMEPAPAKEETPAAEPKSEPKPEAEPKAEPKAEEPKPEEAKMEPAPEPTNPPAAEGGESPPASPEGT